MTRHAIALVALALTALGLAGWTYSVNYETRAAIDRISDLRSAIAGEREALQVLRVEWAWLNRPDRLARLVSRYEEKLALIPLTPDAFGSVAEVPYPPDLPPETPPDEPPAALLVANAEPTERVPEPASEARPTAPAAESTGGIAGAASTPAAPEPPTRTTAPVIAAAEPAAAAEPDPILASAEPATMQDAVRLALIEAGVLEESGQGAPDGGAAASGSPALGAPVPAARPPARSLQ